MLEQFPAGRSGRLWLIDRLAAANRGATLLDRKRQLLQRRYDQLSLEAEARRRELSDVYAIAQQWGLRAAMLGGSAEIELIAGGHSGRARVTLSWQNTMGVTHPAEATCDLPELAPAERAAANTAIGPAAGAYRRALEVAVSLAVAETARARVEAELHATQRRWRAIRRHRIPSLADALRQLELSLDELEREDRIVTRWARARRGPS